MKTKRQIITKSNNENNSASWPHNKRHNKPTKRTEKPAIAESLGTASLLLIQGHGNKSFLKFNFL